MRQLTGQTRARKWPAFHPSPHLVSAPRAGSDAGDEARAQKAHECPAHAPSFVCAAGRGWAGAGVKVSGVWARRQAAAAAAGRAAKRRNGDSAHMCVSQSGDAGGGRVQACSAGAGQGAERGQAGPGEAGPCPRPAAGCRDRLDTGDGRNSRRQRPSEAIEGSRAPRPRRRAARGG